MLRIRKWTKFNEKVQKQTKRNLMKLWISVDWNK